MSFDESHKQEEEQYHAPPPDDDDSDEEDDEVLHHGSSDYFSQQQMRSAAAHRDDDDDELQEPEEGEEGDAFTSIWDMVGPYAQSPLDTMLAKENVANVTLEQVLDEETLIQEIKSANAKVLDFIAKEDNVKKMLQYLVKEYYREDNDVDMRNDDDEQMKLVFKFPYIVNEVFNCDVDEINEKIVKSEENIWLLLSYLVNKQHDKNPVNPCIALYFVKTMTTLLQKHYVKIAQALQIRNSDSFNVLKKLFVDNLSIDDIDQLTLKILGFETSEDAFSPNDPEGYGAFSAQQRIRELFLMRQRGNDKQTEEQKKAMQNWAIQANLPQMLMERASARADTDDDAIRNMFSIFTEIVDKGNNAATPVLLSNEFLSSVLDLIFAKNGNTAAYLQGITFLHTVIEACDVYGNAGEEGSLPEPLVVIHSRTKDFISMLDNSAVESGTITTSFGDLSPPLGEKRLRTVEHLHLLFKTNLAVIHCDLMQLNAIGRMLDLFFTYEFNNLLHCQVAAIIRYVIEQNNNSDLKKHLLADNKLGQKLIQAYNKNNSVLSTGDPKAMRLGYMGHVFEISNLIKKLVSTNPANADAAQLVADLKKELSNQGWDEFVQGPLNEANMIHERQLGGPTPLGSSSAAALAAFQQSGLMMSMGGGQYGSGHDNDDDEFIDDDSDDSDDSDDDEVVVKKTDNVLRPLPTGSEGDSQTYSKFDSDSDEEDDFKYHSGGNELGTSNNTKPTTATSGESGGAQENWADFDEANF